MKKSSTASETKGQEQAVNGVEAVAGLDVGDKWSHLCMLATSSGEVVERSRLATTEAALRRRFAGVGRLRIALEAGVHSPWISRLLHELGHEVIVANPRQLRLIYGNRRKNDPVDAESLGRLARLDPALLHPIEHRGEQGQADLALVRSRDLLVRSRTQMINHVRSVVKSFGARLPGCSAPAFAGRMRDRLPVPLRPALLPVLESIATLSEQIRGYDKQIEEAARKRYPEVERLQAIHGVGTLSALSFVLVLEEPERFPKSRSVGAYLGLVPGEDSSGEQQRKLRISKEGDKLLRQLLVQCGHYILGPFGKDCDLRHHGQKIVQRGGPGAKKRAAVAVARKLAVLLHRLWCSGEVYDPHHNAQLEPNRRRPAA